MLASEYWCPLAVEEPGRRMRLLCEQFKLCIENVLHYPTEDHGLKIDEDAMSRLLDGLELKYR